MGPTASRLISKIWPSESITYPINNEALKVNMDKFNTDLVRKDQMEVVGSELLYERLDQKLKNIEVDPFLYNKQLRLFNKRNNCFILLLIMFSAVKKF